MMPPSPRGGGEKRVYAARKTISLPGKMFDEALVRMKRLKYKAFSDYIQYLVEKDLEERPSHSFVREESPEYPPPRE